MSQPILEAPLKARSRGKIAQILSAAGRLFRQHGYAATNMDAVAREADVSKATLYVYFSGKQELFAAVIQAEGDRRSSLLIAGAAGLEDMRARLLRYGYAIMDLLLAEETVTSYRMVVAEAARFPELGELYYANGAALLLARLEQFFESAMSMGRLRPDNARRAAEQFVGLVRGDLMLRALLGMTHAPREPDRESVIRAGVDTFWRAYRPEITGGAS
jgi:TetR/AcrR family transcriptional regulator, mexJK operon transcriptional repressor